MVPTGRVRDRAGARPRSGDGGNDFVGLVPANGGAPSSLTRPQRRHHTWPSLRENPPTYRTVALIGGTQFPSCNAAQSWQDRRRRGPTARSERTLIMAKSKPTARDALIRLRAERDALLSREASLREEAASELGKVLLECGAETLEPAQLKQLMRASMTLGIDAGACTAHSSLTTNSGSAGVRCPRAAECAPGTRKAPTGRPAGALSRGMPLNPRRCRERLRRYRGPW